MSTKPDVVLSILEELQRQLNEYNTCSRGRRSFVEARLRRKIEPLYKLEVWLACTRARHFSSIDDRNPQIVGPQRARLKVFSCALEGPSDEDGDGPRSFYIDVTLDPQTIRPYKGSFLRIRLRDVTELTYVS